MGSFVTSDGVRLNYADQGSGVPIVFSGGWAMDGMLWWQHQVSLSSRYRVIVLDPRSQGASEKVSRGIRLGRQAKDLRELFELLGLTDVVHVAWSRSSSIALAYWELFGGDLLSGLVLVGITPSMARRPDWEWGYTIDPLQFQEEILNDHEGVVRRVVEAVLLQPPSEELFEEMVRTTMATPAIVGARMLEDHGAIDWRDMLGTIDRPTLVCVGQHDRNAPKEAAEFVSSNIPGALFEVFAESAHAPFFEEPEKFNEVLTSFIRDCVFGGPIEFQDGSV